MTAKLKNIVQTKLEDYPSYIYSRQKYGEDYRNVLKIVNNLFRGESLILYDVLMCPICGSSNIKKHQNQKRKRKGEIEKYKCNDCGSVFLDYMNNLKWTHFSADDVAVIVTQLVSGTTHSNICRIMSEFSSTDHLNQHTTRIDRKTITNIAGNVADLMRKFESKVLKLEKSREWQIDEIFQKKGNGNHFKIINVIDVDTRYILATHVSESRGLKDALAALSKAINNARELPEVLKCDGHVEYKKAAERLISGVKIQSVPKSKDFSHINVIEGTQNRMRGTISRRKTYKSMKNLQNLADIFRFDHNFFFRKENVNKPPVTHAGIDLPSNLTWKKIIQIANLVVKTKIVDQLIL